MRILAARGRLFRKYVAVLILLVGGMLLLSSVVNLYFSYRETKAALIRLQRQQALAAASRIEQFVKGIEEQVKAAMEVPFTDPAMAREQREIDFLRLLRDVPAITEIVQLDAEGRVQVLVSRLAPNEIGSGRDLSADPRFMKTRIGRTYFGPVHFRNESEPYLTIAVPWGEGAPEVAAAEVDLRSIWHVDRADPRGRHRVRVRRRPARHPRRPPRHERRPPETGPLGASADPPGPGGAPGCPRRVRDQRASQGARVVTSHAAIEPLGWLVFAEQPLAEAFAPLQGAIVLSGIFFVAGLGLSILASVVLARRMVTPIRVLQDGAARIGAGDLGHRIDVRTGDELGSPRQEFNRTAAQLEESYANLEQKVESRTRELAEANADLSEALEQQTATSEVLKIISRSTFELQPVLETPCRERHQAVRRRPRAHLSIRWRGVSRGSLLRRLRPAEAILGITGAAARARILRGARGARAPDGADSRCRCADAEYEESDFQKISGFRTMLGVPMLREGELVGAIVLWRTEVREFTDRQIELVTTFADQAVIAIENVRLLRELQSRTSDLARSVEELRALGEVGQAVNSTLDLETVLNTIATRAVQLSNAKGGVIYEYHEARNSSIASVAPTVSTRISGRCSARLPCVSERAPRGKRRPSRAPVQVADVLADGDLRRDARPYHFRAVVATGLCWPCLSSSTGRSSACSWCGGASPGGSRRKSWISSRPSRASPSSPSRTRGFSGRSPTRAGSSRWRASTSRNSSPACPTSSARR